MGRVGVRLLVGCAIGAATMTVGSTPAIHATVFDTAVELSAPGDSEPAGPATSNPDDRDDSQVVEATLPGSSETDEPVAVTAEDDDASETLAIIALVVAGIGLVVAVAAVMLARRRPPSDAGPG
jgi:hypothetical protein